MFVSFIFVLIILALFVACIAGLFNPRLLFPKAENPTRRRVFFTYVPIFILALFVLGYIGSNRNITNYLYKNERRMKTAPAQILKGFQKGFITRKDPENMDEALFGEQSIIVQDREACFTMTIATRYEEIRDIQVSYRNILTGAEDNCNDYLILNLTVLENIFPNRAELYPAIRQLDSIIAKGGQSGKTEENKTDIGDKTLKLEYFPNLGRLSLNISPR